jgi:transmembrane sensor
VALPDDAPSPEQEWRAAALRRVLDLIAALPPAYRHALKCGGFTVFQKGNCPASWRDGESCREQCLAGLAPADEVMMASGEDSPANRPPEETSLPSMSTIDDIASAWAMRSEAGGLMRGAGRTGRLAWRRPSPSWRIRSCAGHSQPARRRARCAPCCRQGWGADEESLIRQGRAGGQAELAGLGQPVGAGVLAAMAASLLFLALPAAPDYATKVGEQRQVRLADGSLAALNTDSQLDVAYSTGRRDLILRQGEPGFRLPKAARPFEVHVGPVHVRATGTAFSVRRADKGVWVVVTEGRVLAWVDGAGGQPVAIARGDEAC